LPAPIWLGGAVEANNDVFRLRRFGVLTHPLTSLLSKTVSARKERVRYSGAKINSRVLAPDKPDFSAVRGTDELGPVADLGGLRQPGQRGDT